MTSPLRRKRPTTRPNSRRTNSREPRVARREPRTVALRGLAAVTLLAALVVDSAGAAELKWRSGRVAMQSSARAGQPEVDQKAFRGRAPQRRVDAAVKQTALFEDEGPQFSPAAAADAKAQWRSVVVDTAATAEGGEATEITRSAQLPEVGSGINGGPADAPPPPGAGEPNDLNSQLEEDLRLPFGNPTEPLPDTMPPGRDDEQDLAAPDTGRAPTDGTTAPENDTRLPPAPGEFRARDPQAGGGSAQPRGDTVPNVSASKLEEELKTSRTACADSMSKLRAKTIDTVELSIAVVGTEGEDFPYRCTLDENEWHGGRCWPQTTFLWKAAALCHKPLYFEDAQLERYGHSFAPCCQPLISGAHFFCTLPVLPYCMGVEPPLECIYALGHYRPGSCAPYMIEPVPLSYRGALFQAGAVVGAAAALP